jgi:Domain of unknown function (DUF4412)
MQQLKLLSLLLLCTIAGGSCSNNNAAVGANGTSSSATTEGGSGADMYYEYTMTTVGSHMNMGGSIKLYVSAGGKVRSEMDWNNPAAKMSKSGPIVFIASMEKPDQSISIDDSAKTYTVNTIDTADFGKDPFKMVSTASKIGDEKILGYNSVHGRVITTKSMGPLGKMTDTVDLWNSPDLPLAPFFRHYMDRNLSKSWTVLMTPAAVDQLKQMGCTGFMMRMQSGSKDSHVNMELTKVRKDDFSKSMFEIPAGYKEEKN